MSKSPMEPSTLRLSEFAKSFVFPKGIQKTVWPRVEAKGLELGLGFDWWQSQLGMVCLGYDERGKYVATVGGIGLSIPRQVGKTYFVLAMLVVLCVLFPGLQVVWTAHHLRTSTKTFTTLRGICRRKKVAPLIKPGGIRSANGEQQVAFTNGSMIMFGARSQGFGRGFDEIDVEVFDEAQILDTKALEDMIAATNQARNEHGALLFFMGTPPRPSDPSEAFEQRRLKARTGKAKNAIWLEIGADPASDPDDRSQWPVMNPSFPSRTPVESMERLRENLADDDSWNREGRGIWDEDNVGGAFPPSVWLRAHAEGEVRIESRPVVCLDVRTGLQQSYAIAAAGSTGADFDLVVIQEYVPPGAAAKWSNEQIVAETVAVLKGRGLDSVVLDKYGENAHLRPLFEAAGITVVLLDTVDMRRGVVGFTDGILNGGVKHLDQEPLNDAVRGAEARNNLWSWQHSSSDLVALRAATAAWWVHYNQPADYDVMDSFY